MATRAKRARQTSPKPWAVIGITNIGAISLKIWQKPHTNHYKVSLKAITEEESPIFKGWEQADSYYRYAAAQLRLNPLLKLNQIKQNELQH